MSWVIKSIEPSTDNTYLFLPSAIDPWEAVTDTFSSLENFVNFMKFKTKSEKPNKEAIVSPNTTIILEYCGLVARIFRPILQY